LVAYKYSGVRPQRVHPVLHFLISNGRPLQPPIQASVLLRCAQSYSFSTSGKERSLSSTEGKTCTPVGSSCPPLWLTNSRLFPPRTPASIDFLLCVLMSIGSFFSYIIILGTNRRCNRLHPLLVFTFHWFFTQQYSPQNVFSEAFVLIFILCSVPLQGNRGKT